MFGMPYVNNASCQIPVTIYPDFPSNPTQLAQIVADIHGQKHLPLKYDSDNRRQRPDLRHGWPIGEAQLKIIVDWLLLNEPTAVCRYSLDTPDPRHSPDEPDLYMSAMYSGRLFAWHYGVEGGVTYVYTLDEHGNERKTMIFFFETNEIVPDDRCTPEEWGVLARALKISGQPTWYLQLIC
ncbi:hypothetical protein DFH06DRAFT_1468896 [Mycena polygramma]|nr:hypothetical protein DFH06DRAFT_1468896 [Mycena polygramma]